MRNAKNDGDSGGACTACTNGWIEFKVVKEIPIRNASGSIVDYKRTVGITNGKCGVCNGTGKVN